MSHEILALTLWCLGNTAAIVAHWLRHRGWLT